MVDKALYADVRSADDSLQAIIRMTERVGDIDQQDYIDALKSAVPEARREAQKQLKANYNASGVKTRTGRLLRAITNSLMEVFIDKKGSGRVKVSLPGGKDKDFYVAANSVNYGRVNSKDFDIKTTKTVRSIEGPLITREQSRAGRKRRQKLKEKVQKGLGKGRLVNVARGLAVDASKTRTTKAGSAIVETTLGTATVTKAFDFYKLSPSQELKIVRVLYKGAREYLERMFQKAIAA